MGIVTKSILNGCTYHSKCASLGQTKLSSIIRYDSSIYKAILPSLLFIFPLHQDESDDQQDNILFPDLATHFGLEFCPLRQSVLFLPRLRKRHEVETFCASGRRLFGLSPPRLCGSSSLLEVLYTPSHIMDVIPDQWHAPMDVTPSHGCCLPADAKSCEVQTSIFPISAKKMAESSW